MYREELEDDTKMENELKIIKIKDGLCFRIRDMIFVNENLEKQNPKLYLKAIHHETEHSPAYKFNDFFMDLKPEGTFFSSLSFMIRNPRSFKQLIPFFVYDGHFYIDYTLLFLYTILLSILVIKAIL